MSVISVSNAAQLSAALSSAVAGDTISLAAGDYGDVVIRNQTWDTPIQVVSADAANPAHFRTLIMDNVHGITFKSLDMGYAMAPAEWVKTVDVGNSSHLTFDAVHVHGSLDGNPNNDANGMGFTNCSYITVINSEFEQLNRSAIFGNSHHIEVANNNFHDLSHGGVHFAAVQQVRITGNRFSDFFPVPGGHPDAIQFWEVGTTVASSDILVMDNVILQGRGRSTQGIFFGNDGDAFDYTNVTIVNNLVFVDGYLGLALGGGTNVVVEGNTVVSNTLDGYLNRIGLEYIKSGSLRNNVTDVFQNTSNPGLRIEDNLFLNEQPERASEIRDLNAGAAATVEGLLLPGIGYRIPSVPSPRDPPRYGTAGNDIFYMGASLDPTDRVYAGNGRDVVAIQGNYDLTLGRDILVDAESMTVLPGSDSRFGDLANNEYSYRIKTIDWNTSAGTQMTFNAAQLGAREAFTFDGSAETDGKYLIYAGKGADTLTGGAGGDIFFFGEDSRFAGADRVDGRDGHDVVVLRGNYSVAFSADAFVSVESVSLNPALDTRFGALGTTYSYALVAHDSNVAGGATVTFNGARLGATETMTFDGSAEQDGYLRLFGGSAADQLTAGQCADLLYGGRGADILAGGNGSDTHLYLTAAESTGVNFDRIIGFDCGSDKIDLPHELAGFTDILSQGSLSTASFDGDLALALSGLLGVGEAALFTASTGDLAGRIFGIVDANGIAGYQAGGDYVFEFSAPAVPIAVGTDFFV